MYYYPCMVTEYTVPFQLLVTMRMNFIHQVATLTMIVLFIHLFIKALQHKCSAAQVLKVCRTPGLQPAKDVKL